MQKLREFRQGKGLSMDNMARVLSISLSFYEKVERGHTQPSRGFMQKLKKAYPEASIDEIFFSEFETEAI